MNSQDDIENTEAFAYIQGVMEGDGYIDKSNKNPRLCLMVIKKEFAMAFAEKLKAIGLTPRWTERNRHFEFTNLVNHPYDEHYFVVRATCRNNILCLLKKEPTTNQQKIAFMRGFYDSEGFNYEGRHKFSHHLALCNKDEDLLRKIQTWLENLGISPSHIVKQETESKLKIYPKNLRYKFLQLIGRA